MKQVALGLTEEGAVLDSPAVGEEAFLQRSGEGCLGGQGVVDGDDRDTQLLGPALEVGLMGFGGLGHKAATVDMYYQGLRSGCLLVPGPQLQAPWALGFHQIADRLTVLGVRKEEVSKARLGLPWPYPSKRLCSVGVCVCVGDGGHRDSDTGTAGGAPWARGCLCSSAVLWLLAEVVGLTCPSRSS